MRQFTKYAETVAGAALVIAGTICLKSTGTSAESLMETLTYIGIAVGCGLFGHGVGEIIGAAMLKGHPDARKRIEIERGDERNVAMTDKAKGRAFDAMVYIFAALLLSFALMGAPFHITLMATVAYLFVIGVFVRHRVKIDGEM